MRSYKLSAIFLSMLFWAACGNSSTPFVPTPGLIVLPSSASLGPGETQQFEATLVNTSTTVIWSVDGGDANGTIDQTGLYTAPASISENTSAVVRAQLANNTSTQDTAELDLSPTPPAP